MLRSLPRSLSRSLRVARPSPVRLAVRPSLALPPLAPLRALSTTVPRLEVTPLSAKLGEELKFELEAASEETAEPEWLREFKEEGVWAIEDKPGADEMVLTRTFGNESIRIIFSISDIDAEHDELEPEEPYVQGEEAADVGSGGVGDEGTPAGPTEGSFPIEAAITITKPGQGALTIDAVAQDGYFQINNISYYPSAELAVGLSSEDDWKRQGLYVGPDFGNLDEGVQAEFENYLEERGINAALALTIPDLAEYKEQKEYISWLNSVKTFVEA